MESVIEKFSKKPKIATKKSFTVALEKEKKENERNDELVEIDVLNYQEQKEKEDKSEKPIIIDQTSIITKEDKSKYQKLRKKLNTQSKVVKKEVEEPIIEENKTEQDVGKEIKIKTKRRKRITKPVDISRPAVNEITMVIAITI